MKQISLCSSGFELSSKRTRKQEFLEQMQQVVPWAALVELIEPYAPKASTGRPGFDIELLLRIHFLQQWFNLSDPAAEEALHEMPLFQRFCGVDIDLQRIPDESSILRFRHLLEQHHLSEQILRTVNTLLEHQGLLLKKGTVIDATLIAAPSSTKNKEGKTDREMHQTKKGNQWYFGMKAHIGADAQSGIVHTVTGTAANVHDITQVNKLLHGKEQHVFADAGYQGIEKRQEVQPHEVQWHIAMRPGQRRQLDQRHNPVDALREQLEHIKASIRAKVEHAFRIIKCQFGYTKVKYRGLAKNTA